ncbi:MAG: biotin--[acetyl-CoA-carboxylase] ligase [Bacteroidia bacterium]|nr:biotin--[acetyl-CoA-carboxylase] ligase [Bacteroidia bacterium]
MNTLFIGINRISLQVTDSTNNYALKHPELPEGSLITADFQTGGRGQRGKTWNSQAGKNLLFSIVLKPVFLENQRQFSLNKAIAWGTWSALNELFPSIKWAIKWPNDIYANNKKLAGILSEAQWYSSHIVSFVAGVGLNLNQEDFGELKPMPTSLKILLQTEIDAELVLSAICSHIESAYLMLKARHYDKVDQLFNASLWKKNEVINFIHQAQQKSGKVLETDRHGRLVVLEDTGLQYYQTGDIAWLI